MPSNITVTEISNVITVDATTNEVSVNQTTQEFIVNTRTNKEDIGLGNVDNTADADKPMSDATKTYVDTQIDFLTTDQVEEAGNLYYTQARADARVAAGIAAIDYPVDSVNGQTNAVVLTTSDIAEGTNLYYTDTRVDDRFDILATGIDYPVTAVNGSTGNITLDTDDIGEGSTNLYYTDGRVDTRVATYGYATESYADGVAGAAESYADGVAGTAETNANSYTDTQIGLIDFPVDSVNGQTNIVVLTSSDIAEGTNLYYTDTRVGSYLTTNNYATQTYANDAATSAANSAVAALVDSAPETLDTLNELAAALGDDPNYATTISTALGNKLNTADFGSAFNSSFSGKTTSDLSEGTNLYYTEARVDTNFGTKTTDALTEGSTNLYHTTARVRTSISASGDLSYDSGTGVISYTATPAPVDSVNGQTGVVVLDTDDVAEGSTNLYYTDARARGAISATGSLSYDSGTGVVSFTDAVTSVNSQTGAVSLALGNLSDTTTTGSAAGDLLYYTGSSWVDGRTFNSSTGGYSFQRTVAAGTGSNYLFEVGKTNSGVAAAAFNGPWLGFGYGASNRTFAPVGSIACLYGGADNTTNGHIFRLQSHPATAATQNRVGQLQRGSHNLYSAQTGDIPVATFLDSTSNINAFSATTDYFNVLSMTKRRTNSAVPVNGDRADFKIVYAGTNGVGYSVAKFDTQYDTTNGHSFSMNVYNAAGTTSVATLNGTQKETVISAIPAAGGAPAEVATFNRDNIILGGTTGTLPGDKIIYSRQYISAYDTSDQPNPVANAENLMIFGTTDIANGISIVTNGTALTRITMSNAGIYNIQFSAQLSQTSGGSANAYIWLKKNGTTVADTAGDTRVSGNGDEIMAAWNYVVSAAAGDYFELAWAATDTSVIIDAIAASGVVPGIPSVILTVTPVGA